ncbi:MAG: response regulator, partial [Verrucomicrobiota bacterium]
MSKRILILDDDSDFNNLLTDIYSQADYEVISEQDPEAAIERFRGGDFDLVVTDQKMPGLSGEEFIREIKVQNPNIPVIMVSGYLDNDTIRNLIRDGVGGVFLKPLNVFSLLKRTSALIEEAQSRLGETLDNSTEKETDDSRHELPFNFNSFPCRATRSIEFAKRLYAMRHFKNNLVLIGEEGTDLPSLIEDFAGFDSQDSSSFVLLELSQVSQSLIENHIQQAADKGQERLTLVIPRADLLVPEQKQAVYAAGKQRDHFKDAALAPR